MRNQWLFTLHKSLALIFSLPLLLLALSGFFISVTPLIQSETHLKPAKIALGALMLRVKQELPEAVMLRGLSKGVGGETAHLLVSTPESSRVMVWVQDNQLQQKNMRQDFFYQNKHFHEGFLLSGVGKKLVALSGVGLALVILSGLIFWLRAGVVARTQKLWHQSPRRLAAWHVVLGLLLGVPLLFQSVTGSLIEFHNLLFNDATLAAHSKPHQCTFEEQLSLVERLEADPVRKPGLIYFCRPDFYYLVARSPQGIQQYTPQGEAVLLLAKEDWQGHALSRKGFFVGLHEANIFGSFHYFYNFLIATTLMFFIISGCILWAGKKWPRRTV